MRREDRRRREGRRERDEEEGGEEGEAQVLRNIARGKREGGNITRHVEDKVTCLACSSISISSGDHSSTCCNQIHITTMMTAIPIQ